MPPKPAKPDTKPPRPKGLTFAAPDGRIQAEGKRERRVGEGGVVGFSCTEGWGNGAESCASSGFRDAHQFVKSCASSSSEMRINLPSHAHLRDPVMRINSPNDAHL